MFGRANRLILLLVLALVGASCSGTFDILPVGQLGGPLTFHFKRLGNNDAIRLDLDELYVEERQTDNTWSIIWEIRGKTSTESIEYGKDYPGLKIIRAADAFKARSTYRVYAKGFSGNGPVMRSAVQFSFDEKGSVVIVGYGK